MKILITYDGSECAEAALDDLRRAGLPPAADALVVSVTEVWLPPPPPSATEIVEGAEGWRADSIFVGACGTGSRLGRFLLGSVSAAVAARAHCSVEVTREREA
jgi:nucleotide-binding universal stress UspA family protein